MARSHGQVALVSLVALITSILLVLIAQDLFIEVPTETHVIPRDIKSDPMPQTYNPQQTVTAQQFNEYEHGK